MDQVDDHYILYNKTKQKVDKLVLLLLVNVVIGDSHTGCPSSSLYTDLVQVSDQVSKMAAHVLNTCSSSHCGNILNYFTCTSLDRDVTKQGTAILHVCHYQT